MFAELRLSLSLVCSLVGELLEALPGDSEQFWGRTQIPIALGRLHMAHVDRESWQQIIDRQTAAIPLEHALHCECVTQRSALRTSR